MNENSKWSNGEQLSALEAAVGIARGLPFRPLGARVRVAGAPASDSSKWQTGDVKGIHILSPRKFRIDFESNISNLTGVLREALSSNSRHNRLWPNHVDDSSTNPSVIGKFPIMSSNSQVLIKPFGYPLQIVDQKSCAKPDAFLYPEVTTEQLDRFAINRSEMTQSVLIKTDTRFINLQQRKALIAWVRSAFYQLPDYMGMESVPSFFLRGESGHRDGFDWGQDADLNTLKGRVLTISYTIPSFKVAIEAALKKRNPGFSIKLIQPNEITKPVDAKLESSGLENGRHVVLQDLLKEPTSEMPFSSAPRTKASLLEIAKLSAATIPPDGKTLEKFEEAAFDERSVAPIARRSLIGFTRASLPIRLGWEKSGELTLIQNPRFANGISK